MYSVAIRGFQIYTGDMGTQTKAGHLFSAHLMDRCFGQELLHSTVNRIQVRAFFVLVISMFPCSLDCSVINF